MAQLKLPSYTATKSKAFPAFLIVYCPRDDCPGTKADRPFLVASKEWMRPNWLVSRNSGLKYEVVGRSCPYCFRAASLPKRSDIR